MTLFTPLEHDDDNDYDGVDGVNGPHLCMIVNMSKPMYNVHIL